MSPPLGMAAPSPSRCSPRRRSPCCRGDAADDARLHVLADHHHDVWLPKRSRPPGALTAQLRDVVQVAAEHVHGREGHPVGQRVPLRVLGAGERGHDLLDPLYAAHVLIGLGLQVRVGVVVAAEADVHGDDRRDVGGDQRRRRLRLAGDVVVLESCSAVSARVSAQLPHSASAEASLSRKSFWTVARGALGELVELAQRRIAQVAQRALCRRGRRRARPSTLLELRSARLTAACGRRSWTSSLELPRAPTAIG